MPKHDLVRELGERLSQSGFASHMGFAVEQAQPGEVRLRLPYREELTTARTALHGGAIGSLIDAAGSLCAWSLAEDATVGRTVSCDVSYLAGALGEDIFAEAQVQRRGKALIYSDVAVSNAAGKTLARGLHIYRFEDGA